MAPNRHLRGACPRLHHAAPGGAGAVARHLRRLCAPEVDRPPAAARRHGGRAAAGPRIRRRPPSGRARACATTGATTRSASSRRSRAISSSGEIAEFKTMVRGCMRRESRSSSTWSTTTPRRATRWAPRSPSAGSTTRSYYRLHAGQRALLRRFHGHRQRAQPRTPARAADGHGFPALLGRGDACRRLPLRPDDDAGADSHRL